MKSPNPLPEPEENWALFLDVDGTLIEIADRPDNVRVDRRVKRILIDLDRRFGHALALVSGRSIEMLDRLFAPLRLTAAGLHGLERRDPGGVIERPEGAAGLGHVKKALRQFADRHAGLIVEDKGLSVALHYRGAPELADEAEALAENVISTADRDLLLQRGKMVFEFRPPGPNKGDVVRQFMKSPPFLGRTPVFIGDDVTDEDGFAAVNRLAGHSIRVGVNGETAARCRIESVAELRDWLAALAEC